jgi:hypothetical protein
MDDPGGKKNGIPENKPVSDEPLDKKENASNINSIPTDEKHATTKNSGNVSSINKYVIAVIVLIIILLIIAYFMYHFNILGVRVFIRDTLGLNHNTAITTSANSSSSNTSSTNIALISKVSSYFPSLKLLDLTSAAINAYNLNTLGYQSFFAFGEGNITKAFENGTPFKDYPHYSGILMFFAKSSTDQTLGYFYKYFSSATKEYNLSFKSIPAVVAVYNLSTFSPNAIPQNTIYADGILNSTLYAVSLTVGGATYLSQVNSSLDKLLETLSAADFG